MVYLDLGEKKLQEDWGKLQNVYYLPYIIRVFISMRKWTSHMAKSMQKGANGVIWSRLLAKGRPQIYSYLIKKFNK
jgi:hypothetical protein